ncbi:YfhO family protein [Pseudalkalibacillus caeni]|uniref:YfhO family protein n=1 Tax=Exobacillus caeni TaxID=2574798 RepID=A0A5R9EZG0_9BACL|nr:YfhO family protein [Pseudalkalibacillus caeni]TLS35586.1 hypothetical protein FCL54_19705 [Pseudalkalibacillus caeni]
MKWIRNYFDLLLLLAFSAGFSYFIFHRIPAADFFYITKLGDMRAQYIHFYNQFYDFIHHGTLPFWSWQYGMGGSYWNEFGYYMIGDIFIWMLTVFPKDWFPALFVPMDMLKVSLMALGMYLFLKQKGIKRPIAFLGAMTYPFVGYHFDYFYTHYFFVNAAVFFPYILLGYERVLKENKFITFIVAVFLASLGNFYLMFMISLGLGLYAFFRFFTQDSVKKSVRSFFLFHAKLIGYYLIGLGLSMVVFLPSVISYLKSNAQVRHSLPIENVIEWNAVWETLFWGGGLSFLPFLLIPVLLINGRRLLPYGLLGIVILLIFKYPNVLSFFGGFSEPEELRSFFIFNALSITLAVTAIQYVNFKRPWNIALVGIIALWVYSWLEENSFTHYAEWLPLLPVFFTIAFIIYVFLKKHLFVQIGMLAIMLMTLSAYSGLIGYSFVTDVLNKSTNKKVEAAHKGVWPILPLMDRKEYTMLYDNQTVKNTMAKIDDNDLYRTLIDYPGILTHNASMTYDYNGFYAYNSLIPWTQQKFEMDILAQAGSRGLNLTRGFGNSTHLFTLFANKYFVTFHAPTQVYNLYGYSPIYKKGETRIYKNDYALPVGFVYDQVLTEEELLDSPVPYRERMMFENAIVPKEAVDRKKYPGKKDLASFSLEQIGEVNDLSFSENTTVKKVDEGFVVESDRPIDIKLPVRKHEKGILTGFIYYVPYTKTRGATITASNGNKAYKMVKNMSGNSYVLTQYSYTKTVNKSVFRFGVDSETSYINFNIKPGKFLIKEAGAYLDPLKPYEETASKHQRNGLNVTDNSSNHLKGTVSSKKGGVLFFSIPYSEGWSVSIDGEDTETFPVHTTFTGVKVGPGKHTVEMDFIPEGFRPGLAVTIISLLILTYLILRKRRKAKPVE